MASGACASGIHTTSGSGGPHPLRPMAIFRITSRTRRAALAKKSIRYIVHRRSREQSTITRTLYDQYGITDKDAAYSRIDRTGEWGTCFCTVISPDPVLE